jgi:hypothetical protein
MLQGHRFRFVFSPFHLHALKKEQTVEQQNNLEYSLPLKRFSLPTVLPNSCGLPVPAGSAPLFAHVISPSSASPAMNMYDFALAFAH